MEQTENPDMLNSSDKLIIMEIARIALAQDGANIGDTLDLTDQELDRLQRLISQHLSSL